MVCGSDDPVRLNYPVRLCYSERLGKFGAVSRQSDASCRNIRIENRYMKHTDSAKRTGRESHGISGL